MTLVGLVAGGLGAALAVPLGQMLGIGIPAWRACIAVPVAMLLCAVAALVPALLERRITISTLLSEE